MQIGIVLAPESQVRVAASKLAASPDVYSAGKAPLERPVLPPAPPRQRPFVTPYEPHSIAGVPDGVLPVLSLPGIDSPGLLRIGDPPKSGGFVEKAELRVLREVQSKRTEKGNEWAARMDRDGLVKLWVGQLDRVKKEQGVKQAALGAALLTAALSATGAASLALKKHYGRSRPYIVDPRIVPIVGKPGNDSYPSGHASAAFAAARVIAFVNPGQAKDVYKLAAEVALSRIYAGVHFPSDVVSGALIGTAIAQGIVGRLRKGD